MAPAFSAEKAPFCQDSIHFSSSLSDRTPIHSNEKYEGINNVAAIETNSANLFRFPHIESMSEENKEAMIEFIDASVAEAHDLCFGHGKVRWCPSRNRSGISTYHGRADPSLSIDMAVKTNCTIIGSFEEIMDLLTTETSEDFAAFESAIDPSVFLDGIILETLVPRTSEDRFVCLKWHCTKSLAQFTTKPRDYTYVEITDQFIDQNGRKIGFQLSKSIEADEIISDDASRYFLRGKILSFDIFMQVDSRATELHSMLIHNFAERQPVWLNNRMEELAAFRTAKIRDYLNQKRMNILISSISGQRNSVGKHIGCSICTKTFSFVRKKYMCAACGGVTCNQCSVHTPFLRSSNGKSRPRMCGKCNATLQAIRVYRKPGAYPQMTSSHDVWFDRKTLEDETFISLRSTCVTDTLSIDSSEERMSRNHSASGSSPQTQNSGQLLDEKANDSEAEAFVVPDPIAEKIASARLSRAHHVIDLGVGKYKAHVTVPERSGLTQNTLERVSCFVFSKTSPELIDDTRGLVDGNMVSPSPHEIPHAERIDTGIYSESMAMADMQLHLDRMTEVSKSLHAMHYKDVRKSHNFDAYAFDERDPKSYLRVDSELITKDGESPIGSGTNSCHNEQLDSPEDCVLGPSRASAKSSSMDWSESTQVEGDFLAMLPDSIIMDAGMNQMEQGWKIVHSRTTGNKYYFNEKSGSTLWTEPMLEIEQKLVSYIVL
uniref:Uncharacterized protein AlNc14C268G9927 n=1 Tax=Albugo laibachii Nc14 TaxID=890382 RepID=F0WUA6_9STRA|nr:conserved hypothetical protein [Albugo laibachii Nc14]CCA26518.1 conserved hypothetical protein [Albugo laibachii Nc14]|eukprot:CCA26518.1 conserved hypothetical protein [Albugo laibachii Nc14]